MASRPRHSASASPAAGTPARARGADSAGAEAREVEWQLTAPDLAPVRRWLEQHGDLEDLMLRPLPPQQLRDTYLDTEDWRVMRAGFALRIRQKGDRSEATLKGLRSARSDAADRREITEPLSGHTARALARATGPVGARVRDVAGVKPLHILFEVRTSRQRFAVRRRNADTDLGEIALDEARFSRGNGHRRPMVLTRVELEALSSDAAALEHLAKRLCAECGLHPAAENKFAVGLRAASLDPPRDARPDYAPQAPPAVMDATISAADFAAQTLQSLLREWRTHEPAARLGEGPEGLHKLRVAGRRMDTVLTLFRSCLPAALAKSRPTLKGLIDALGDVRDVDIRLQAIGAFREGLPEGERPALDPLLRHLQSERAKARAAMLRALDANPARHWLDTLPEQLARAQAAAASASVRSTAALTVAPDLIRKRYRKLRKCARRLSPESSMEQFHELRIRAKKLRYALEVIAPTYAKPADRMIARLQKLQSRLGTQHDADVLARYLQRLAMHPPAELTAATLFTMGRLAQQSSAEAARLGGRIGKPWRKVRGRRWKDLRSRMQALRDGARKRNGKIGATQHSVGGSGKPTGAARDGTLAGAGDNARMTGTGTPGRLLGSGAMRTFPYGLRH